MIALSIKQLANIVNGKLIGLADESINITGITTDSRQITQGCLFVALVGEKFDGHHFVQQAIESGAIAALVNQSINSQLPQIVVTDTHQALGKIAGWVRLQVNTKVVALTGSSGKTSVKEMTAAILSQCGETLFTQGNFNNDIGVPLTLFRLNQQHQFAVIELGANHIGEIAYTTQMVKPQAALINNIAEAHLEGFGSLAGVAKAKSEIFLGLPPAGTAIINLDSYCSKWFDLLKDKKVLTFSLNDNPLNTIKADFYASDIKQGHITSFVMHTPIGNVVIELPLIGLHNVSNSIAAAALAISVGASLEQVKQGLLTLKPVKGRLFPIRLNQQQLVLDDSYNANVGSMTAAINVLSQQSGYRILVVGDMAELGEDAKKYHQQIGEHAKNAELDCVVSVGNNSAFISQFSGVGHHFDDKTQAAQFLNNLLTQQQEVTLLVKGSRSAKMEELIEQLNKNNQD